MYMIRLFAGLLLAAVLSACGGGGGSPGGTGTGGGVVGSGGPTIAMQLVDPSGNPTTNVSSTQSSFVKATVRDATGAVVAGTVVTFTSDAGLVAFVPAGGTALTDASGVATIQVAPASGTAAGAATITANASVAGTAAKAGSLGVQVVGSGTGPGGQVASAVELFASSPQLSSSPNSTVSFTVVVKDSQNRAMPGQTVTFTASSGNLLGSLPAKVTGAAGEPVTGVMLSPGSDRSNRDIVVTASSGGVAQTLTIPVTGTALSLVADTAVLLGGTTTLTATARDSNGQPIAGTTITAASSLGNSLTPAAAITDASGIARFTYRGTNSGLDAVSVNGLGATNAAQIAISAEDFTFVTPAANTSIAIGTPQPVTVRLLSGGVPAANRAVTFSTTRGALSTTSTVTDAQGFASTSASSTTSGPASIVARAGTAQALLPVTFQATKAATLVLQVNPGAVPPNSSGTGNQATLQATVRDLAGNPVAGSVVNFTALADLSNGTISPGSGVTDTNGLVTVQFVPGALTTANNAVQIQATVQGTSPVVSGIANLTVSGQALFISIGKGRLIADLAEPVYKKQFSVYVTDANGAPVPNKTVVLSVYPDTYYKGAFHLPDPTRGETGSHWIQVVTPSAGCPNEDIERNGIIGFGRNVDVNTNGKLDPGLPVVITPASVTTDSGGFATFFLEYGKNFAMWIDATITARASVGGTESVQTQAYSLEMAATDNSIEFDPPNKVSPFGFATVCSNPN
jgi:hypothetical protein